MNVNVANVNHFGGGEIAKSGQVGGEDVQLRLTVAYGRGLQFWQTSQNL